MHADVVADDRFCAVTGSEILGLGKLGARLLGPSRLNPQRIEVAQSIHDLRVFERDAAYEEVWDRLGRELPAWSHSGVVPPVTVHKLTPFIAEIDPRNIIDEQRRGIARVAIRLILDDIYEVLNEDDPLGRWFREFRHGIRVRRIAGRFGAKAGYATFSPHSAESLSAQTRRDALPPSEPPGQ